MIVPVTLRQARTFVAAEHRHNPAPRAWLFGCGLEVEGELVGVAIAGRPNGRGLQDGLTVEITRCCTNGTRNACSQLYGAVCRAAKALGYQRAYTYTLDDEDGASVKAAGFVLDDVLPPRGPWSTPARPRYDENLLGERATPDEQAKRRWRRDLQPARERSAA